MKDIIIKSFKVILVSILVGVIFGIIMAGCNDNDSEITPKKNKTKIIYKTRYIYKTNNKKTSDKNITNSNITSPKPATKTKVKKHKKIKKSYILNSGNYISGKHFKEGTYDITAISGNGNVISSNIFDGGINAIMGVSDINGFYEKEYKNVELPRGTKLEIKSVKIKLIRK